MTPNSSYSASLLSIVLASCVGREELITDNTAAADEARAEEQNVDEEFTRGLELFHGAWTPPESNMENAPEESAPTTMVVDFVDITGAALDRNGDTPLTRDLKRNRTYSTRTQAAEICAITNELFTNDGRTAGIPLLVLGSVRVATLSRWDTFWTRYQAVAQTGHFTVMIAPKAWVTRDSSPKACGYAAENMDRSIVLADTCLRSGIEQLSANSWGDIHATGSTLAHEIGHWLGLTHTFGPFNSTAEIPQVCADRDGISDTPAHIESGHEYRGTCWGPFGRTIHWGSRCKAYCLVKALGSDSNGCRA